MLVTFNKGSGIRAEGFCFICIRIEHKYIWILDYPNIGKPQAGMFFPG